MVITLFLMISIMVIDRIIYSTHTFLNYAETLRAADQMNQSANGNSANLDGGAASKPDEKRRSHSADSDVNFTRESVGSYLSATRQDNNESTFGLSHLDNFEEQSEVSDDAHDPSFEEFKYALVPQRQPKRASRVIRVYFLWVLLIMVHYFIFFKLPKTKYYCKNTPQIAANGQLI